MKRILIIQTAFIGDAILGTAVLEKMHQYYPGTEIDYLVRKGNESLFGGHPFLNEVLVWDKRNNKYKGLLELLLRIRKRKYDLVVNLQRFLATGFLTVFSKAKCTIGFEKNPLSIFFTKRFPHHIGSRARTTHEVDRNLALIHHLTDDERMLPKIYPPHNLPITFFPQQNYITISPGSVWFTKQYPSSKWIEFINKVDHKTSILLLGGNSEKELCEKIARAAEHPRITIKAGQLSLLESAALMKQAKMNFTNDSAPTHMATAVNAPVTTIFCSTVPQFGFTPLSEDSLVIETSHQLDCRPCNLHGKNSCPKKHFRCSELSLDKLLKRLS